MPIDILTSFGHLKGLRGPFSSVEFFLLVPSQRCQVASHVVECALLHSSPDERQMLKDAMASNAEEPKL